MKLIFVIDCSILSENTAKMKLYLKELNNNSKITLVLLHGNSSSSDVFSHFINNTKLDINIIAFDLPGHRNSKKIELFDLDQLVDILTTQINALDSRIVLLGNSLGGHLAIEISNNINNLEGLILMGTPPIKNPLNLEECFLPIPELSTYFTENPTDIEIDKATDIAVYQKSVKETLKNDFVNTDPEFRKILAENLLVDQKYSDEKLIFENLDILKFVIHGKEDSAVNFEYLLDLKKTNKKGSLTIFEIEDCGHYPSLEKPEAFEAVIDSIVTDYF